MDGMKNNGYYIVFEQLAFKMYIDNDCNEQCIYGYQKMYASVDYILIPSLLKDSQNFLDYLQKHNEVYNYNNFKSFSFKLTLNRICNYRGI